MALRIGFDACIGCGVCMEVCPDVFKLDENEGKCTLVEAVLEDGKSDNADYIKEAIECCPVGCISE